MAAWVSVAVLLLVLPESTLMPWKYTPGSGPRNCTAVRRLGRHVHAVCGVRTADHSCRGPAPLMFQLHRKQSGVAGDGRDEQQAAVAGTTKRGCACALQQATVVGRHAVSAFPAQPGA